MISFWDTRVGADLTVARQQPLSAAEALQQKITTGEQQSAGSAWAAMTAPGVGSIWDRTAIEARVDPSQEQSRLGTSLSKSVTLDERTSLTLQNSSSLTQQGVSPIPGITGHQARNYAMDQSARLSIADTGTSFIAGQTLSSTNNKWLRKIGAEQQLFAASASPARSARRCRERRTRASPRASSAAGKRFVVPANAGGPITSVGVVWGGISSLRRRSLPNHNRQWLWAPALSPGRRGWLWRIAQERSRIAADWPRCGQNRRDGWLCLNFVVRGTSALAIHAKQGTADERHDI